MFMSKKTGSDNVAQQAKKIHAIYQKYLARLSMLQKKQNDIISQFSKELEKKRIDLIKKRISEIKYE